MRAGRGEPPQYSPPACAARSGSGATAAGAAACPALPAAGRRAAAYIALVLAVVAAASYGARLCPDMRPGPGVYAILAAALASPIAAAAELVAA